MYFYRLPYSKWGFLDLNVLIQINFIFFLKSFLFLK
jgi:hypothetical protein